MLDENNSNKINICYENGCKINAIQDIIRHNNQYAIWH